MDNIFTKTGTVGNSFWSGGRSVFVYWNDEDGKIGHQIPLSVVPDGEFEFGEGTRIRITLEVIEDKPAKPNPYCCGICHAQGFGRHRPECPVNEQKVMWNPGW